jgi:hypothetical protein
MARSFRSRQVKRTAVVRSAVTFDLIESLERRRMLAAHIVGSAAVYATIQQAVDAANAGATITVFHDPPRGPGTNALIDPRARLGVHDVPRLGLQVTIRMRVGVVLIRMNLHREIFAGIKELDQNRELLVRAGRLHVAKKIGAELLDQLMERSTGERAVGDFGADPVLGAVDDARGEVEQLPGLAYRFDRRQQLAENRLQLSAAPDLGDKPGLEFQGIKEHRDSAHLDRSHRLEQAVGCCGSQRQKLRHPANLLFSQKSHLTLIKVPDLAQTLQASPQYYTSALL